MKKNIFLGFFILFFSLLLHYTNAQMIKILPPKPDSAYQFGNFVGIDNNNIAILSDDTFFENDSGSLYIYNLANNIVTLNKIKRKRGTANSTVFGGMGVYFKNNYLILQNSFYNDQFETEDSLFFFEYSNGVYNVFDTISIKNNANIVHNFCMRENWLFLRYPKPAFVENNEVKYKLLDVFYKKIDGKWAARDSFEYVRSYDGDKTPTTMDYLITDRFVVVGDSRDSEMGRDNGSITIYENRGGKWYFFQKIFHPNPYFRDSKFGMGLTITDNNKYLAVNAIIDVDKKNKVYLFTLESDHFVLKQTIPELGDQSFSGFGGDSMCFKDSLLFVGNPYFERGNVLIYEIEKGVFYKKYDIKPPNSDVYYSIFGLSLDIYDETLVVGADFDSTFHKYGGSVYIFQIPARDTLRAEICEGESYTFNDTIISTEGHYVDTLMASYGVDSVVQLYLNVRPKETINFDTILCSDETLTIGNSIISDPGNYKITLQNIYGCDSTMIVNVGKDELEVLDSIDSDFGCSSGAINLTLLNANNPPYVFNWNTDYNEEDLEELSAGEYSVSITDHSNCLHEFDFEVPDSVAYLIPNAFFPSGTTDDINSTFTIYRGSKTKILSMEIFNRWGEKVFETNDNTSWDGTYKGKAQSPGVYIYKVTIESPCGVETESGQVMLLR